MLGGRAHKVSFFFLKKGKLHLAQVSIVRVHIVHSNSRGRGLSAKLSQLCIFLMLRQSLVVPE